MKQKWLPEPQLCILLYEYYLNYFLIAKNEINRVGHCKMVLYGVRYCKDVWKLVVKIAVFG